MTSWRSRLARTGSRRVATSLVVAALAVTALPAPAAARTTVSITNGPAAATRATSATVRWSKSPSSLAVTCRIDSKAFKSCSGTSKSFTGLREGRHTFQLKYRQSGRTITRSRSWIVDRTAPRNGFVIAPFTTDVGGSASVFFNTGQDAGSGISTWRLQRRHAAIANGACGSFGAAINVGPAKAAAPLLDAAPPSPACVRYLLVVKDKAGNTATFTSDVMKTDASAPTGTFVTFPSNPAAAELAATGTAADAQSGIAEVRLEYRRTTTTGPEAGTACTAVVTGTNWTCSFRKEQVPDGVWTLRAIITNGVNTSASLDQANLVFRNSAPGITVEPTFVSQKVREGGPPSVLSVILDTVPSTNVVVALNTTGEFTVTPTQLTFTPANWEVFQDISATAIDDTQTEPDEARQLNLGATSADTAFNGLTKGVAVTVQDNDSPSVFNVDPGFGNRVVEGGLKETRTFSLGGTPASTVTLSFASNLAGLSFTPPTLTFTPGNAAVGQNVVISAVDDAQTEAQKTHTVSVTVASGDAAFSALAVPTFPVVEEFDNDFPSIRLTPSGSGNEVAEGGPVDTYTVVLGTVPSGNVVVTLNRVDNPADFTVTPGLTFTPANALTPQTVTIAAVDDMLTEGQEFGSIFYDVTSGDAGYNGLFMSGTGVAIDDND